jgi:membrane-bound lytic murein transglycosylase B
LRPLFFSASNSFFFGRIEAESRLEPQFAYASRSDARFHRNGKFDHARPDRSGGLPLVLFLGLVLAALFVFQGCGGKAASPVDPGSPVSLPGVEPRGASEPLAGVKAPWSNLAGQLRSDGLPEKNLKVFFNSPDLEFNSKPMVAKLRELHGIYFRSDLTKAVQEKLYQLGYDILIDGRMGSGTKKVVSSFQSSHGMAVTGQISDALDKRLTIVLTQGKVRDLSEYKPPAAAAPSRTTTYPQFTNATALQDIKSYYLADKEIFDRMEEEFGTPGPLVASIMWIETGYGRFFGSAKAAHSLASMAASADYGLVANEVADIDTSSEARAFLVDTAKKRGDWATDELKALLNYAWRNKLDPSTFLGSLYGAIGYGQFMPSNIDKFAVDGNKDGRIDLFDKTDAIFSIGKYLRDNGWKGPMTDQESRRQVIMRYNRSGVYVNTVLYVADYIGRP